MRPRREPTPRPVPRAGRITDIVPQRNDPERVSISIDGAFAFGLPAIAAAEERLRVGDEIDAERAAALLAIDERARAVSAALAFLAYRPRSEREVRDRLRQKGCPPATIDYVIEKLAGWRYLDDADFAKLWVDNRIANQPRGRRALEQELRRKGIAAETARDTLDAVDLDERAAARETARKRLRQIGRADPTATRRRLADYLARRGFGYDTVRPVLDELLGETDDDAPGE